MNNNRNIICARVSPFIFLNGLKNKSLVEGFISVWFIRPEDIIIFEDVIRSDPLRFFIVKERTTIEFFKLPEEKTNFGSILFKEADKFICGKTDIFDTSLVRWGEAIPLDFAFWFDDNFEDWFWIVTEPIFQGIIRIESISRIDDDEFRNLRQFSLQKTEERKPL